MENQITNRGEIMDKLELWIGTFTYYLNKIAPYMLTAVLLNLMFQLVRMMLNV